MKFLSDFKAFYSHPFRVKPLLEIILEETEAAIVEVAQCDHTIQGQRFIRHMALAKVAAMEAWNHRGDAK